jgi:hypothetical protein
VLSALARGKMVIAEDFDAPLSADVIDDVHGL